MIEHEIIARALAKYAPAGWQRAWLAATVGDDHVGDIKSDYIDASGQENWFDIDDTDTILDISQALVKIRETMRQSSHQSWSSCKFTLSPDGKFSLDVAYDEAAT